GGCNNYQKEMSWERHGYLHFPCAVLKTGTHRLSYQQYTIEMYSLNQPSVIIINTHFFASYLHLKLHFSYRLHSWVVALLRIIRPGYSAIRVPLSTKENGYKD
ncbi:hypothetical protein WA026_006193, partial [Henosepilachna vigintioctopunctata]